MQAHTHRQSNASYQPTSRRKAELSRHARQRCQQRALKVDVVPVITSFGERGHDGRGGIRFVMTSKAMAALVRTLGRNQRIDGLAGAYVVISADDGTVITIGHRYS
jgi:hypothetical protein